MLYKILVSFLLVVAFCQCDDEPLAQDDFCDDFAEGELILGLDSTLSTDGLMDLAETYDFHVNHIQGLHFASALPADSLNYVKGMLKSREYINNYKFEIYQGGSAYVSDGVIHVLAGILDPDRNILLDFNQLKEALQFTEISDIRFALLKVPVGREKEFSSRLIGEQGVISAELNCYAKLERWPE